MRTGSAVGGIRRLFGWLGQFIGKTKALDDGPVSFGLESRNAAFAVFDANDRYCLYSCANEKNMRLKVAGMDYRDPDKAPHSYRPATVSIYRESEINVRRRARETPKPRRWKDEIITAQEGRCFYCRSPITKTGGEKRYVLDHLIPRSAGGPDALHNRVAACPRCDMKKGARFPTEEEIERKELHNRMMGLA